jgi:hypothetical protein
VPVAVRLPDLVAFGAGAPAGVTVVEARAGEQEDCEEDDEERHDHTGAEEFATGVRHVRFLHLFRASPSGAKAPI